MSLTHSPLPFPDAVSARLPAQEWRPGIAIVNTEPHTVALQIFPSNCREFASQVHATHDVSPVTHPSTQRQTAVNSTPTPIPSIARCAP
jgi:hypothetical protein